ncbi:sodium:sulfate symporter transmembrane region domain protein, partial [Staphylococcus aureus subsp. aureus 21232]
MTGKLQKSSLGGVLILFGGGLALAKGISESGLAKWLGEQ